MRRKPDASVKAWLDAQPAASIWTTSISVLEIRSGIETLPVSRRRAYLDQMFNQMLDELLQHRVMAFDTAAGFASARMYADLHRRGVGIEICDLQIAGITHVQQATLATRNVKHFQATGINTVTPWG